MHRHHKQSTWTASSRLTQISWTLLWRLLRSWRNIKNYFSLTLSLYYLNFCRSIIFKNWFFESFLYFLRNSKKFLENGTINARKTVTRYKSLRSIKKTAHRLLTALSFSHFRTSARHLPTKIVFFYLTILVIITFLLFLVDNFLPSSVLICFSQQNMMEFPLKPFLGFLFGLLSGISLILNLITIIAVFRLAFCKRKNPVYIVSFFNILSDVFQVSAATFYSAPSIITSVSFKDSKWVSPRSVCRRSKILVAALWLTLLLVNAHFCSLSWQAFPKPTH